MSQHEISSKYLIKQVNQLRKWSLNLAAIYFTISIMLDYGRFPPAAIPDVLTSRFLLMFLPLTVLMVSFFYQKKLGISKSTLDKMVFIVVSLIGIGHAEILAIAENYNIVFPKIGITIILIYAGLLLALPVLSATFSSLVIIGFTCYTYHLIGMDYKSLFSYVSFYLMFSSCCVFTNLVCIRILGANYNLVKEKDLLATTDELTGLKNRRHFYNHAEKVYKEAIRENKDLTIILVDLDNFKAVNDFMGHKAGDGVLKAIANILNEYCRRPFDIAARIGGDEFVMLIYDSEESHIEQVCKNILSEVRLLSEKIKSEFRISDLGVSMGVAKNNDGIHYPIKTLLEVADKSLYETKSNGKNNFIIGDINKLAEECISSNFFKPV